MPVEITYFSDLLCVWAYVGAPRIEEVRNQDSFWLGGKHDLMLEHRIERKLSEAELGAMVEVLRRHIGDPGRLRKEANAHIWSPTESSSRAVNIRILVRTITCTQQSHTADAKHTNDLAHLPASLTAISISARLIFVMASTEGGIPHHPAAPGRMCYCFPHHSSDFRFWRALSANSL